MRWCSGRPASSVDMLAPEAVTGHFHALIAGSDHGAARNQLRDLVDRIAHDGRDTIASLTTRLFIEFRRGDQLRRRTAWCSSAGFWPIRGRSARCA